eukprot:GGOE01047401.1.p1 GENE.GGOE01047401.1~~GGOE01047401.1.p1  ORF type:complete len:430 (-),score=113.92 GGOE01047401.1:297-1586(-)
MAQPKRGLPAWNMLQCDGNMMALKRSLHSAVTHEGYMFVFGGSANRSAEMNVYSFGERRWETHPPKGDAPECLWGHSAVKWNGCMFVFGGCEQDGKTSNRIYCFNLGTKEWSLVPVQGDAAPLPRTGHSAVLLPGTSSMIIFAGEHQPNQPLLNDLWTFDFRTCVWQHVQVSGVLPRGRKHHTTVEFDDKLYIFGGTDSRATFNDFYIFDIKACKWSPHEGAGFPPTERFGHVAVVHNRRMHVFGGLETVQMYSSTLGLPVTSPFVSAPGGIINGPVTTQNLLKSNSIYFLNDWYKYSFRYMSWIRLTPNGHIPSGRWGHTALEFEGKLYIFGGANHKGCLNDMYDISMSSLSNDVLQDFSSNRLVSCSRDADSSQWTSGSSDHPMRGEKRQLGLVYDGDGVEEGAMDMDHRDPVHPPEPRRSLHVRKD